MMGAGVALLSALACTTSKKSNFLFLYADDLSPEALSVLGSQVQIPNLDRLARRGVIFTNTYNPGGHGAICVASRTMLLTGHFLWNAHKLESRLDEELQAGRLWPQYLALAGYDTYMTGKWHVNTDAQKHLRQPFIFNRAECRKRSTPAIIDHLKENLTCGHPVIQHSVDFGKGVNTGVK